MRPQRADIAAPELPPGIVWLASSEGEEPRALAAEQRPVMATLSARGPVLVHFFDFAQLNSVRSLPYVLRWEERYRAAGLATIGVHTPRLPFTAGRHALAAGLARLGISHPVALDADHQLWLDYGCEGWPALFLWGKGGALRWAHLGEGEYAATEDAIQHELRAAEANGDLPDVLEPLRPTDAPGAMVAAPSEEIFPGGSFGEAWQASGDEVLDLTYAAGGAAASVDGEGKLRVALDGEALAPIEVGGPSLVELAEHPSHGEHRLEISATPGVRIWSISFAPGMP